jgi:hypothetical protein
MRSSFIVSAVLVGTAELVSKIAHTLALKKGEGVARKDAGRETRNAPYLRNSRKIEGVSRP